MDGTPFIKPTIIKRPLIFMLIVGAKARSPIGVRSTRRPKPERTDVKIHRITTFVEASDHLSAAQIRGMIDVKINTGEGIYVRCEKHEMRVEYMDQLTKQAGVKD